MNIVQFKSLTVGHTFFSVFTVQPTLSVCALELSGVHIRLNFDLVVSRAFGLS